MLEINERMVADQNESLMMDGNDDSGAGACAGIEAEVKSSGKLLNKAMKNIFKAQRLLENAIIKLSKLKIMKKVNETSDCIKRPKGRNSLADNLRKTSCPSYNSRSSLSSSSNTTSESEPEQAQQIRNSGSNNDNNYNPTSGRGGSAHHRRQRHHRYRCDRSRSRRHSRGRLCERTHVHSNGRRHGISGFLPINLHYGFRSFGRYGPLWELFQFFETSGSQRVCRRQRGIAVGGHVLHQNPQQSFNTVDLTQENNKNVDAESIDTNINIDADTDTDTDMPVGT